MTLDLTATQTAIAAGLPLRTRWLLRDTPLDLDFSHARRGLRRVTGEDVAGGVDDAWAELVIFGACDFATGGGASSWLTIRSSDGSVCGLDVERDPAIFPYNSSLERFIRTFVLLNGYFSRRRPLPADVAARVQELDPECYPGSEWRSMIEELKDE